MASVIIFNANEEVLEAISDALVQAGHETTSRLVGPSTTVSEIAQFVQAHRPDVVLYELRPPLEQAEQAWRELRAQPEVDTVPFVLTTSAPDLSLGDQDCPIVAVLRDPYSLDEVVSAVDRACSRKPGA